MIPARIDDPGVADVGDQTIDRTCPFEGLLLPEDSRRAKQFAEDVHRALLATGQMWRRNVAIAANGRGAVVLQGQVPTYYHKQLAQSVALSVAGVTSLENQITVQ
ncbi:MAG TPA: BON domain-containing protein [Planctomycetaceae bacterium]|nr:BON domain-containing protein [Planctomycetaceae bacterium]